MTVLDEIVRVRVAGLIVENDMLLLISHKKDSDFYWLVPGGGVDFGESLDEALKREFLEELNISVNIHNLAFICDSIHPFGKRHIINIFFYCSYKKGKYILGNEERLQGYKFFKKDELKDIKIFPPINDELTAIMEKRNNDIYIGKMWLGK